VSDSLIRHEVSDDGSVQTIVLDSHPGNVISIAMCGELAAAIEVAAAASNAKVLVFRGAGKHFSFGASVEEHLPDQAAQMLAALGGVIRSLVGFPYPTMAGVQGSCLGGGLELVLACGIVIAEQGATMANPEIQLGVIAPVATALLDGRAAEDILLTGRSFSGREAHTMGIVNVVAADGELDSVVSEFVDDHFVPRSAFSLRIATKAVRAGRVEAVDARLAELDKLYVDELLPSHDGIEGIKAFLERRSPVWTNN
jgi:cyclohexa-1,5-dienecarbonyl-CoA hydratase